MKFFHEIVPLEDLRAPRVVTSGVFDGLHLGHQVLVRRTIERARAAGGSALVLTFADHPLATLAPPYAPKRLLSVERKRELLEALGVDVLVMPEFTPVLASLTPRRFVDDVLAGALGVDVFVAGFDYRYGVMGDGDARLLVSEGGRCGFEVEVMSAVTDEERPVSSTRVREAVAEGRMRRAAEMLGRPYELDGVVEPGYGRGSELGYPTANLRFDPGCAAPVSGVYAVYAELEGTDFRGMMNIGASPTFTGSKFRHEVFLFDYEGGALYGRALRVRFIERLREERRFQNAEALKRRLAVDERLARALLEREEG